MTDAKAELAARQRRSYEKRVYGGLRFICGFCKECGESFVVESNFRYQCFCSKRCHIRESRRRQRHRRRARKLGVPSELISLSTLAERDGWRCHICKRKVTRKNWSIDHLVPLSDGGHDTYANTALAHRQCNVARAHRGHAQLRLDAARIEILAAGRATKPCDICGEQFVPKHAQALTCSGACRAEKKRCRENARYYELRSTVAGRARIDRYRIARRAKERSRRQEESLL